MSAPPLTKVIFTLPEGAPSATESMWAKRLGNGLFQIDNTPWYVTGYALGDVVHCTEKTGELPRVTELVTPSGNLTVRVFVPAGPEREMRKQRIVEVLRQYGCMLETMGVDRGLIAVTIPRDGKRDPIFEYLDGLEASKRAYWEAGNF